MPDENERQYAAEQNELAHKRTNMSQGRTQLSFVRTYQSNTQTFLVFLRTAISVFAAGIGMFEFIENHVIMNIGIVFMAISPVIIFFGGYYCYKNRDNIREIEAEMLPLINPDDSEDLAEDLEDD